MEGYCSLYGNATVRILYSNIYNVVVILYYSVFKYYILYYDEYAAIHYYAYSKCVACSLTAE